MSETQATKTFTTENFKTEVLESDVPVLVDFWATWCPPCRQIAPIIDALATEYEGKAKIGKVDLDANRPLGDELAIQAVPTLLFYRNGEIVERIIGAKSRVELEALLDSLIEGHEAA